VQASQSGQVYYVSLVNASNQMIKLVPLASYGGNPAVGSWTVYSIPLADLAAGLFGAYGILCALEHRDRLLHAAMGAKVPRTAGAIPQMRLDLARVPGV